jgi:ribosomal protein L11 methyltransferase
MNYLEVSITAEPELSEILMAELAEVGFESFVETDAGLLAYIPENLFSENEVKEVFEKYRSDFTTDYTIHTLEKKNWNEEWEKSYEPVRVDDTILVRASFHPSESYPFEIVINPKMSFGTGHHETTELMLRNQLNISHSGKTVIDAGCGTGILAIMAAKLGASHVVAFDIEDWAVENTKENCNLNFCNYIQVGQGTIRDFDFKEPVDILLANINRNILLDEMEVYASLLKKDGTLVLSGFYEQDIDEITAKAKQMSLHEKVRLHKNNWVSLRLQFADLED